MDKQMNVPNMILIGSTARNGGKTTLAAAIIEKLKRNRFVVALKITSSRSKTEKCIHGAKGCGVCSGFKGVYELTEELSTIGNKDTAKLLTAGADKVYWLKSLINEIDKGFEDFLSEIPENAFIICESNSLRKYVNPGVFIMINNSMNNSIKLSAVEVMSHADTILENNWVETIEEYVAKITESIKIA